MENTMEKSVSHLFMCEFHLMNGVRVHEGNIPGGWANFPFKEFVTKINLYDRLICPQLMFGLSRSEIWGFAVHWISQGRFCSHNGVVKKYREIMVVFRDLTVHVSQINTVSKNWKDYRDDLKNPKAPHLHKYNLEVHGITI